MIIDYSVIFRIGSLSRYTVLVLFNLYFLYGLLDCTNTSVEHNLARHETYVINPVLAIFKTAGVNNGDYVHEK